MTAIALVTGANQGLGLALAAGLARTLAREDIVYLAARDGDRGMAAMRSITGASAQLRVARLDVRNDGQVVELARSLEREHGGVDIVISNAAARISPTVPVEDQVDEFVDTNNLGTTRMLRGFVPLLRPQGKFVVVASAFGRLSQLDARLHPLFDTANNSLEAMDRLMLEYAEAVRAKTAARMGWPEWINVPSKVGQVACARIAAREVDRHRAGDDILVAAACPGLVDTDASRPWFRDMSTAQAPEVAARDVLWLVLSPRSRTGAHGALVQHRRILPWL